MATRFNRFAGPALAAIASLIVAGTAHADIDPPDLSIDVYLGGDWAWGENPNGEQIDDSLFFYEGAHDAGDWSIDYTSTVDPDPFVTNNITITNNLGVTQNFLISVVLPIAPALGAPTTMDGSVGVTLTDSNNDGSATLMSISGGVYQAQIDGSTVASLLTGAPYSLSVLSAGGTEVDSDAFGPIAGPAASSTIAIVLEFSLSPGDSVGITSFFEVVPAPGGLAVLALGGIFGVHRRRRIH